MISHAITAVVAVLLWEAALELFSHLHRWWTLRKLGR